MTIKLRSNGLSLNDYVQEAAISRSRANDLAEIEPDCYVPDSNNGYLPDDIVLSGLVFNAPLYKLKGDTFKSVDANHFLCTNSGTIFGKQGRTFNGSSDYIALPATSLSGVGLNLAVGVTWEFWLNPTPGGWRTIFSCYLTNMKMLESNAAGNLYVGAPIDKHGIFAGTLVDSVWRHYAVVCPSAATTDIIVYRNLTSIAKSGGVDGNIPNPEQWGSPLLGISIGDGERYAGVMGEFRIYNRALSLAELTHNFQATRWRY